MSLAQKIQESLATLSNPLYAAQMSAYMKGHFEYFGIQSPIRKAATKSFINQSKLLSKSEVKREILALWAMPQRECQYVGMEMLDRNIKKFDIEDLNFVIGLVIDKSWWDTVDGLVVRSVGTLLKDHKELHYELADEWISSENLWLRRTAILFQLKYRALTDFNLLKTLILEEVSNKEFFVQKACGWALREYSRISPVEVMNFIYENEDILSTLCKNQGLKWLREQGKLS